MKLKSLASKKWLKERPLEDGTWEQRKYYIDVMGVWHEVRNGEDTIFADAEVKMNQSVWTLFFPSTGQWVQSMENIYGYNSSGTSIVMYKEKQNFEDGEKWRYSEVVMVEKGKEPKVRMIGTYTNQNGTRNEDKCVYEVVGLPDEPMNGGEIHE